ncbi:MAG: hypothetical protein JWL70_1336 [Acidimicrobiia bacterium]|nr:hypothetical protein [Acidimicrobiia bacterium]
MKPGLVTGNAAPVSPLMILRSRRLGLSAAVVGASAWFGAAGLATGFLAFPERLVRRLPFASPVVAGLALALIIALPYSGLAWLAWRNERGAAVASLVCGVVLVGWIVVELAVVRELSFLQPLLVAVGAAFGYAGRRRTGELRAARHKKVQ